MMHRLTVAAALACVLSAPLAAYAQDAGQPSSARDRDRDRDRVMALLTAFEHVPTAQEFTSIGEGARETLVAVAKDESQTAFLRARAVWALGFFPDDTTRRTIEALLAGDDVDERIVRSALAALASAFGPDAVGTIRGYLDDPNPDVREAAAKALGVAGGDEALRALRRRLGREESEPVRAVLAGEIDRMERSSRAE